MDYKAIIKDAWHLTQVNKPLMWWYAFIPELIGILVGVSYLIYQVIAFWESPVFHEYEGPEFFNEATLFIGKLIADRPAIGVPLVIIGAIIGLLYFTLPMFSKAALVQLIARIRNGQQVKVIDGISHGLIYFLRILEYRLLIRTFSVIGVFTEASFIVRNLGTGALAVVAIPLVLMFFFGIIALLIFAYTEYYIIIDDKGVLGSMGASARLVIRHWQHTILIMILMALITLRIVLNIILVLLIPSIIILSTAVLAVFALAKIGFIVGIIVALIGLYFSAYLAGILEVFSSAVWVFTFLELTAKEEVSAREKTDEEEGPQWVAGGDEAQIIGE